VASNDVIVKKDTTTKGQTRRRIFPAKAGEEEAKRWPGLRQRSLARSVTETKMPRHNRANISINSVNRNTAHCSYFFTNIYLIM